MLRPEPRPLHTESNFTYETPERLFGLADYTFPSRGRKYDISSDGQEAIPFSGPFFVYGRCRFLNPRGVGLGRLRRV